ncbi:P-loop containing nucleoside triphosphate hydrolase protein, partial [Meira miltonrushii]
ETIKLSYLSLSSNPLRSIIKHARGLFKQSTRGRVSILRVDRYGNWHESGGIVKRSVDSVHLPSNIKERLLEDAKNFLSPETRRWYEDRGIPYRRGYLLHGVPGSGKSSLCHVLASETDRPIYILNLSAASMDDEEFNERMGEIPGGALVLIEDVDAAFVDREASIESQTKGKRGGGISFSTLLNAIDGIGAIQGRVLCLTTNHIDKLDPALIRPGRIDLRFEFKNANQEQAKELFLRWYMPRHTQSNEEVDEKDQESKVVQALADQFAGKIKAHSLSVAAIQGFLLSCGKDYQKAVKDIDGWMEE